MSTQIPGSLPPNTIVPESDDLFIPYFNRLYEDIAYTVNAKDNVAYQIAVTSTDTNILNVPNFGAFTVCVSGTSQGLPTIIAALCKASSNVAGNVTVISSQAGNLSPWIGATLTITSTATNFQIRHSVAGQSGNFNIKVIGSQ